MKKVLQHPKNLGFRRFVRPQTTISSLLLLFFIVMSSCSKNEIFTDVVSETKEEIVHDKQFQKKTASSTSTNVAGDFNAWFTYREFALKLENLRMQLRLSAQKAYESAHLEGFPPHTDDCYCPVKNPYIIMLEVMPGIADVDDKSQAVYIACCSLSLSCTETITEEKLYNYWQLDELRACQIDENIWNNIWFQITSYAEMYMLSNPNYHNYVKYELTCQQK